MTIEDIKTKINELPLTQTLPSDSELNQYMNLAELILNLYYNITDEFKESEDYINIVSLEISHLLANTPWEDVLAQYNYLSSFNVAGAISGTVAKKYAPYLSLLVKAYLNGLDIQPIASDNSGKSYYSYSIF